MATYRPLTLGADPRVLSLPRWLMYDDAIGRLVRALRKAPGATLWQDGRTVLLILPETAMAADGVRAAFYALLDEMTVWRLSTADGTRMAFDGCAPDKSAQGARYRAGVRIGSAA